MSIVLITGIQVASKSTVAQGLAETFPRRVHVRGDLFRRTIINGRSETTSPSYVRTLERAGFRQSGATDGAGGSMSRRTSALLATLVGAVCLYATVRLVFAQSRPMRNDVVQGALVGIGLAIVTVEVLSRVKATKVNGWITIHFEPGSPLLGHDLTIGARRERSPKKSHNDQVGQPRWRASHRAPRQQPGRAAAVPEVLSSRVSMPRRWGVRALGRSPGALYACEPFTDERTKEVWLLVGQCVARVIDHGERGVRVVVHVVCSSGKTYC